VLAGIVMSGAPEMKPDRFEILVYLSGIAVAALITTAAFGITADKPPVDSGSNSGNASTAIFTIR
jgi:hypothetical protein